MKGTKQMTDQNKTFQDRQRENKAPIQYALFKGVTGKLGAMRLNLKKAYSDDKRDRDDGCIFLEMAPATGNNIYDWENGKIIMALNMVDIPKILMYLRSPGHKLFQKNDGQLKIYHDKGAGTASKGEEVTTLTINKPDDKDNFFFSAYQKKHGTTKSASVTVSHDEAIAIGTLFQASIPLLVAWNSWTRDEALHDKLYDLEQKMDRIEKLLTK